VGGHQTTGSETQDPGACVGIAGVDPEHASEYDEKEDIVRVKVKPKKVDHTERLQYYIEMPNNMEGKIAVAWEKIKVELPFKFKS
jgi:hypothetical protein